MAGRKHNRVAPAIRRQLEVAAAVASEELVQVHATRAQELVTLAQDRVTAPRMLFIYSRVHHLDPATAQAVMTRVLARIGQVTAEAAPRAYAEGEEEEELGDSRSLLRVIRERLRGRIHLDLRRWVELHTGLTEVALLDVHTTHALRFTEMLAPDHSTAAAVDIYSKLIGVRDSQQEVLYHSVLARMARAELPGVPREPGSAQVPFLAEPAARASKRAV